MTQNETLLCAIFVLNFFSYIFCPGDVENNFDQAVTRAIANTFPFRGRGCNLELKSCNLQAGGANSLAMLLQSKSARIVSLSLGAEMEFPTKFTLH
jgi:hypothetical protein